MVYYLIFIIKKSHPIKVIPAANGWMASDWHPRTKTLTVLLSARMRSDPGWRSFSSYSWVSIAWRRGDWDQGSDMHAFGLSIRVDCGWLMLDRKIYCKCSNPWLEHNSFSWDSVSIIARDWLSMYCWHWFSSGVSWWKDVLVSVTNSSSYIYISLYLYTFFFQQKSTGSHIPTANCLHHD